MYMKDEKNEEKQETLAEMVADALTGIFGEEATVSVETKSY